ncbi:hypothetical protein MSC49_31020 [Methylosinus sp. C49]|uniref:hypothetical protein n=1 Tax=Methylosinus sp. C49 TaxID=2699395 RepID=UPI001366C169|nr:hypothetical protein [Methylosinus sp. C49]BBU63167.1 hypothetical protein MSC49_31020 [Methylosinus sp. C49]
MDWKAFFCKLLGSARFEGELVKRIDISKAPFCITLECRQNEDGIFGVLNISGAGSVDEFYLDKNSIARLAAGLSDVGLGRGETLR